jgi:hypothetical protein
MAFIYWALQSSSSVPGVLYELIYAITLLVRCHNDLTLSMRSWSIDWLVWLGDLPQVTQVTSGSIVSSKQFPCT